MEKLHLDEKGSPYYLKNRIKNPSEKSLEMLYRAIDLIKEGCTKQQVLQTLLSEGFKQSLIDTYISVAYSVISTEFLRSETGVFNLHFERYSRDIKKLFEKEFHGEKWIEQKTNAYFQILLTLEAKEKLLGLHKSNFNVIFNQRNVVKVTEKPKHDISKLTWEEKLELLRLFELTRREEEFTTVTSIENVKEETVVEEIVEEAVNIDRIKHKEQPEPPPPPKTYTGLQDTFEKMKKTFEEIAKQKFKDAGSKTV